MATHGNIIQRQHIYVPFDTIISFQSTKCHCKVERVEQVAASENDGGRRQPTRRPKRRRAERALDEASKEPLLNSFWARDVGLVN